MRISFTLTLRRAVFSLFVPSQPRLWKMLPNCPICFNGYKRFLASLVMSAKLFDLIGLGTRSFLNNFTESLTLLFLKERQEQKREFPTLAKSQACCNCRIQTKSWWLLQLGEEINQPEAQYPMFFTPQTIISKLKYDLNTAKIAQYYYLSTNKKRRIGQSKSFQ